MYNQFTPEIPRIYDSYSGYIQFISQKYNVSLCEANRALKKLKKLGLIRFSTRSKHFRIKIDEDMDLFIKNNLHTLKKLSIK